MKIKKVKPARLYSRKKNPELKRILLRVLIVLGVAAAAIAATAAYGNHLLRKARESAAETAEPATTRPALPDDPVSPTGISLCAYPIPVSSMTDIWAVETQINRLPEGTKDAVLYLFREGKAPLWKNALKAPLPLYEGDAVLTAAELADLAARKEISLTVLADAPSLSASLTAEESAAAAGYERMYLSDLVRSGLTRILLRLPDVSEENIDRIVRYAADLRGLGDGLSLGAVLSLAIREKEKPELLLAKLSGSFDFLTLDLTEALDADVKTNSTLLTAPNGGGESETEATGGSFPTLAENVDAVLELFSRYEMTPILRLPGEATAQNAADTLVPFLHGKALDSFILYTEN